jgi:hypothetical protein
MLSFEPPYAVIDGYTLLTDHADPGQWYALPPAPTLAVDGGRPSLSMLEYLGGGAGKDKLAGAVLDLSTTLAVPDATLELLASKVRDRMGGAVPSSVTVQPVLYEGGSVELVVLGSTSHLATGTNPGATAPASAGPAAAPAPSPFNVVFAGSGLPSLGGDNRASFQLLLDEQAAQLVDACLDAPDLPILVIYRMQLTGLRPSFSIKVEADWHKVYHDLEQRAMANVYYVSADVQSMVSKTLEADGVHIDETIYGAGPDAAGRAEAARKFLLEWVTNRLFTPFVDPSAAMANAIGQVVDDSVFSLTRSVLPGLGYKMKAVSDDELRTMSARMDETVAERREIVPQGTLGGLLNALRLDEDRNVRSSWPATRSAMVQRVNLADFPRLEVGVGVEDRFATDGLAQVTVELARSDDGGELSDRKAMVFRKSDDRETYVVNLLGRALPSLSQPYRWRADIAFDPAGPFGSHPPTSLDWRPGSTKTLIVEPREAYMVPAVSVRTSPSFSWSQFPAVDVDLRYADPTDPHGTMQHGRLALTETKPEATWRFRAVVTDPPAYTYRATYERPSDQGGPISPPEQRQVDDVLTVADPMPRKRRMNIFVALPWDKIATAFLGLQYRDPAHGIATDEQLDLSAETKYIRRDIPIAADGPMAISYRVTVLFNDGRLLEGSWRSTEDDRLVIDRTLLDSRAVSIRVVGGPLAAHDLAEVHVRLQVADPAGGPPRAQAEFVIDPGNEGAPIAPWEYLRGDPPAAGVRYQGVFIDDHGFAASSDWKTSTSDLLVVSLAAGTVSG